MREALDIFFSLQDHIDEGRDDVILFADEGGSWQVGVDWVRVLPAWFKVHSVTAGPEECAGRIDALLTRIQETLLDPLSTLGTNRNTLFGFKRFQRFIPEPIGIQTDPLFGIRSQMAVSDFGGANLPHSLC